MKNLIASFLLLSTISALRILQLSDQNLPLENKNVRFCKPFSEFPFFIDFDVFLLEFIHEMRYISANWFMF